MPSVIDVYSKISGWNVLNVFISQKSTIISEELSVCWFRWHETERWTDDPYANHSEVQKLWAIIYGCITSFLCVDFFCEVSIEKIHRLYLHSFCETLLLTLFNWIQPGASNTKNLLIVIVHYRLLAVIVTVAAATTQLSFMVCFWTNERYFESKKK